MRRIPSAFVRDPETGFPTGQPAFDWFAAGHGVAYRKWDGKPCLLEQHDDGWAFYRGIRLEPGDPVPLRLARTSPEGDRIATGWLPISGEDDHEDPLFAALGNLGNRTTVLPGSYELCGPGINDNPEGLDEPTLLHHRLLAYLHVPRQLDPLIYWLAEYDDPGEGIVWWYGDAACQITRLDVGLPWPLV
jgi:hypothetical protein